MKRKSGFTLVELIAAIAIIGILTSLLLPIVGRIRESGNASKCISNMKQIGEAAALVIADNDGRLPERLDTLKATAIEGFARTNGRWCYCKWKGFAEAVPRARRIRLR